MKRPIAGLCLPVRIVKVRDADTFVVRLPTSSYTWAIRLLDCWAPEKKTPEGKVAKAFVEDLVGELGIVHLWIPAPEHVENLLKNLTFDRLLGHLFIDERRTLSELIVQAGHATKIKQG